MYGSAVANLLLAALVVSWGAAGLQTYRLAVEREAHANTRTKAAEAVTRAVQAARAEERRRVIQLQGTVERATTQAAIATADARRARAAGDRLRDEIAAVASRSCPAHPAATTAGAPTDTPAALLADLLGRLDEAAGVIASHADAAAIAGRACESAYDALTKE